jgi:hypothetical protein
MKHTWRLNSDGDIDIWALDIDYHNGPVCIVCEEYYCHHCRPDCFELDCAGDQDAGSR